MNTPVAIGCYQFRNGYSQAKTIDTIYDKLLIDSIYGYLNMKLEPLIKEKQYPLNVRLTCDIYKHDSLKTTICFGDYFMNVNNISYPLNNNLKKTIISLTSLN